MRLPLGKYAHAGGMLLGFLVVAECGQEKSALKSPANSVTLSGASDRHLATVCDTTGQQICLRDTAYAETHDGVTGVDRDWIWFGKAHDSIEVLGDEGSFISTNLGTEHDADHNNVPYFRSRLTHDGIVVVTIVFLDRGALVPYELRIRRERPDPAAALRPTGKWARLNIISAAATDPFTVIPLSLLPSVSDVTPWTVLAMPYNIALLSDSLYQVCRVPCTSPDTVRLVPGARVTRKY